VGGLVCSGGVFEGGGGGVAKPLVAFEGRVM